MMDPAAKRSPPTMTVARAVKRSHSRPANGATERKKIIVDEHSGRILVDALLADEQSKKMNRKIKNRSSN